MPMTPLAFIDQYLARYQSHNPALWNYEDGCVLAGCRQLYQATGEEKYLRFVLDYLDARVAADGTIPTFDTGNYNIDAINCGKALFLAWDATGEEKYRKALDFHAGRLAGHPRCVCGSFWHKEAGVAGRAVHGPALCHGVRDALWRPGGIRGHSASVPQRPDLPVRPRQGPELPRLG